MHTLQHKVTIIGTGKVGATAAFSLLHYGYAHELVLLGRDVDSVAGEVLDLEHSLSFLHHSQIIATDNYQDIINSSIVIVTAGAGQKEGETRLDLAKKNLAIMEEIIPRVVHYAPEATIVMVTNPVDILTYHAYKIAGLPKGQIFGTGTILDTARYRFHLSQFLKVNPQSIHAYILGEHGDNSFPTLSSANVGGQPIVTMPRFNPAKARRAYKKARDAAYKIIQAKGATYYAIAAVITHLVSAILKNKRSILPVSIPLHNYYGHNGIALSVPCVVGKRGVEETLAIKLSLEERQDLTRCVKALKQYL